MEPELGRIYDNDRPRFEALARRWTWKYAMFELQYNPYKFNWSNEPASHSIQII